MKKIVSIKGVIDNIRQSINTPSPPGMTPPGPVRLEQDILETLSSEQFCLEETVRHGFPYQTTCVAFDQIQKLLAIGTRSGSVRIFGRPGVDLELKHEGSEAVTQLLFVLNTGKLLTTLTDDSVNMWDYTQKPPELLNTLKINKEQLTHMSLEFQDKWLYLGTSRGNVYVMNLEQFQLSGYNIMWNKCTDPLKQTKHPGDVTHVSVNPADDSKLLIGFKTGLICLWDLPSKKGEQRYQYNQRLWSISWNLDGRQFVCSYGDGSLVTWNVKPVQGKPQSVQFPHGKRNKETNKVGRCDAVEKVLWRVNRSGGEPYYVFAGGLPEDVVGTTPSITIMQGKNTTVLEMEDRVLDFLLVTDSPYSSDYQEPEAVIVMLQNDLVAIDCKAGTGYKCFNNPYAMDFSESPVTCCRYLVDCPGDLIPALYMVGTKTKSGDFSAGEWPVSGGVDSSSESACSYTELVITGHQDGSVRFWDASSTSMQSLHRIKTAKYFERAKGGEAGQEADEDPYAVKQITLCGESKDMAVAGAAGQVLLFRFRRKETATETKSMEIPIVYEVSSAQQQAKMAAAAARAAGGEGAECASPSGQQHFEFPAPRPLLNVASQSAAYTDPVDGFNFDKPQYEYFSPLKVRPGAQRKTPGFHAELACLTPWVNGEKPTPIACLALNSSYGLMAYGNGAGLAVIDYEQGVCLLNMGSADLYGSLDPFQRMPKSPKPLEMGSKPEIVKVDLGSYNQVSASTDSPTPGGKEGSEKEKLAHKDSAAPSKAGERVRSPDPRRLQKGGSSTDENNLSKSSSNSSLADGVVATEGITCLHFADAFTSKNDFTLSASLQVGTSLGSVITVVVTLPDSSEARKTEPVVVSPSGTLYRLRGKVLAMRFLDASSGCLLSRGRPAENVKVPAKSSHSQTAAATTPNLASVGGQGSQDKSSPPPSAPGPGGSPSSGDQEVMLVCTDKTAAVYALPSQRQMYSQTIDESSSVVRAAITNFGGSRYSPCLACYTGCGMVKVYSLPSLRPLCDGYLVSASDRVESTLSFSDYGHGLYFCNQNELQKFTISKSFSRQLPEMQGTVFQDAIPMPDPPSKGIFSIFSRGTKPLDREELFGETAGKAAASVATTIPGTRMANIQSKGAASTSEVSKAHAAFLERGQKLNEIEDRTEQMADEAEKLAKNSKLLLKQTMNKKWYQL